MVQRFQLILKSGGHHEHACTISPLSCSNILAVYVHSFCIRDNFVHARIFGPFLGPNNSF